MEANRVLQGKPFNCIENPEVVKQMQLTPSPTPSEQCPECFASCQNADGDPDLICEVIEATKSDTTPVVVDPSPTAKRLRIIIIIIIRKDRVDVYILVQW